MKKQIRIQALFATSLLAISLSSVGAQAALTKLPAQPKGEEAIVEDQITPEAAEEAQEEVVVVRKPKTVVKRIVREQTEITPPLEDSAPLNANSAQAVAVTNVTTPPATKPSAGSQLDAGIKSKMEDVQVQFEQALLKTLDRIKITVDEGSAPQGSSTPTQSTVVQDSLVAAQAAPNPSDYMPLDSAPKVKEEEEDLESDGSSVAALPSDKRAERKVRIAPVFGKSSISPTGYNVDSRYTAGFELEMDVESNFALVLGYSYSQYTIGLASSNPLVGYYQPYGGLNGNLNGLDYNQNLFEGGMRLYLMPRESKFRIFGGAGVGYNLGYLNYRQNAYSSYQYNPYFNNVSDYEVKSWLGLLSAGASLNISENVSLGALFKYALMFSSSENQPLNNYAFVNNVNYGQNSDQAVVGGSLARENFYSILGTVKVAF